ncbi:MAG: response regulator [Spirochaetales bacterium]|nr:response regulator [Spirochaetales bacterium]
MYDQNSIPELLKQIHVLEKKIVELQQGIIPQEPEGQSKKTPGIYTENKDIAKALEKSEKKYRSLFEDAPISLREEDFSLVKKHIDALKANGVIDFEAYFKNHPERIRQCLEKVRPISINKVCVSMYEAKSKEDFMQNFTATFPEESLVVFGKQLVSIINGKSSNETEDISKTLTGKMINISVKWVIPDEYRNTWSRILISVLDITEKKQAEELLRIQRDISIKFGKFNTIKEICSELLKELIRIETIDSGGVYLRNLETGALDLIVHQGLPEKFIKATSYYNAESPQSKLVLKGEPVYLIYAESNLSMDTVRSSEGLKALAVIPVKHSNEVVAVLNVASHKYTKIPVASRNIIESISGMIGSFLAHVKAESALRESDERYQMLIHNIPYVTWISDLNGNTVFISENVIKYYGFTPEEICENHTRCWFDRIHPEDVEKVKKAWLKLFEKDGSFDIEYRIKRKDNIWIWLHDRAVNTYEKKGVQYAYGIFADITNEKQIEEHLRQSEKMQAIGELAGGIAHDFNNQLAAILTYSELIKSAVSKDHELTQYVQNIISCINHSTNLTSQLLAFSRKGKYQSIEIDMHDIIMEIINILSFSIDKKIIIEKNFRARSHFVSGDPSQLENAFLNIALNARDAITGSGKITFTTDNINFNRISLEEEHLTVNPGKYIMLLVRDNGVGMDAEIMHHLFEPFFTTKRKGKGTGMGMAAVYGTIIGHKGAIRVFSEPGKGTSVKIYLPVIHIKSKIPKELSEKTGGKEGHAHILFVDDEQMIRESIQIILTNLGYEISLCKNGIEALDFYSKNWEKVDLVILDMIMPEMNGYESFVKMREINPYIKALLLSGYSTLEDIKNALENGISGFIHKPFGRDEIVEKIELILNQVKKNH